MSEAITRRKFMKCAGAAILAVSAAGMLAGCKKEDIPDVPGVTTKELMIVFFDAKTEKPLSEFGTMTVAKDATAVNTADIPQDQFPKGYTLAQEGELPIRKRGGEEDDQEGIFVYVTDTKVIKVYFAEGNTVFEGEAEVKLDATVVTSRDVKLPEGYELDPADQQFPIGQAMFVVRKV